MATDDAWTESDSYDAYMGRWSRRIAPLFLDWFAPPVGGYWLEIGCGTGALTEAILDAADPAHLLAIDPSEAFVARTRALDRKGLDVRVATAEALPAEAASVDVVASALTLNFVPDRVAALAEIHRVLRPGGRLGVYVWDYPGGGMELLDHFWKAAADVDPAARELDEAARFPDCTTEALADLVSGAGFDEVRTAPLVAADDFADAAAVAAAFTMGVGPAPAHYARLSHDDRLALERALERRFGAARPVRLSARAIAVAGRRPAA